MPTDQMSEQDFDATIDFGLDQMSDAEREKLSKALFPETHTDTVKVLGKERLLRPLTIRYARVVNKLLQPYLDRIDKQVSDEPLDANSLDEKKKALEESEITLKYLLRLAGTLAEFYGKDWEDIKEAVSNEDISLVELEDVAVQQAHLNSVNDFLLVPLRTLIRILRWEEMRNAKLETMANTSISLQLRSFGGVPSMSLSPDTQTAS